MRFFEWAKDGGPESTVDGFYIIELKDFFSILLLKFNDGSRDNFHDHAFSAVSWLLKGKLSEELKNENCAVSLEPSLKPIFTHRDRMHKVRSIGTSWALSFRGPWRAVWHEYDPKNKEHITLIDGRKRIA